MERRQRRKLGVLFIVGVLLLVVVRKRRQTKDSGPNDEAPVDDADMEAKIDRVTNSCRRLPHTLKYQHMLSEYFHVKHYNITYCSVRKGGSTSMQLFFFVLSEGEARTRKLENYSRINVHGQTERKLAVKHNEWKHERIISIGRDPYARLFSAFTDRVFLPSDTASIRKGSKCRHDMSFEEFLRIILLAHDKGKMDPHWSPIYHSCNPCDVIPTYVVHVESFTKDIQYVLRDLKLNRNKQIAVNRMLTESRTKWTITGIVKNVMEHVYRDFTKPNCVGWHGIIKRLWKAFQINGYINDTIAFPEYRYNGKVEYSNVSFFLDTIVDTITKNPLSVKAAMSQRRRALVAAYSSVSANLIGNIKRIFHPDFEMFGYSDKPPL